MARRWGELRDGAPVATQAALVPHDVVALVIGRERLEADLSGQGQDSILGGSDPLTAQLQRCAVVGLDVERPAADAITGFKDKDGVAGGNEVTGC